MVSERVKKAISDYAFAYDMYAEGEVDFAHAEAARALLIAAIEAECDLASAKERDRIAGLFNGDELVSPDWALTRIYEAKP